MRFCLTFLMLSLSAMPTLASDKDIWLLVDTGRRILKVMEGEEARVFAPIAIGRNGAGFYKTRGDDKTPLGEYRIGWINDKSKFHRFFGFTYPNLEMPNAPTRKARSVKAHFDPYSAPVWKRMSHRRIRR
ncbi:MAG: L,D-transpeptidase family protein [Chromatiales bacterium]|nr:L,D-transpeptidase family protein [Chromatiales bacterium]